MKEKMTVFNPQQIIAKKIEKDYPNEKILSYTYNNLERVLTKNLRGNNKSELNELKIESDIRIQHIEITNFDNFVGIRLNYYAVILAIFAIILSNEELASQLTINPNYLINGIIIFLIIVIVSHNISVSKQRENLIYYRFKLNCIDKIITEKNKNKSK